MIDKFRNKILIGHVLDQLAKLPDNSVDMMISSPPYWGLRDYETEHVIWDENIHCEHKWQEDGKQATKLGHGGITHDINAKVQRPKSSPTFHCTKIHYATYVADEGMAPGDENQDPFPCTAWLGGLGLEPTPTLFIQHLVQIFMEVKRVLKPTGTLWVNLGDTYAGSGNAVAHKSLIGIPDRLKIALIDSGLLCRNEIIWYKPNCMPQSAKDRFTNDTEKLYLFSLQRKYYFEQQFEPHTDASVEDLLRRKRMEYYKEEGSESKYITKDTGLDGDKTGRTRDQFYGDLTKGRNKRTTWKDGENVKPSYVMEVQTRAMAEAHFACVDQETEILTESGWKDHNSMDITDSIATFNVSNEKIYYHKPYGIYKYDYNGKIIIIENQWTAQYVTPNHRILLKYRRGSKGTFKRNIDREWNYYRADEITVHSGIQLPVSGEYRGYIKLDKHKAELIGWIITDGHLRKSKSGKFSISIYQSLTRNREKVIMIENCLVNCGVKFSKSINNRKYNNKPYQMINFYMGIRNDSWKWILDWINPDKTPKWKLLHIQKESMKSLYKSIILGDGNVRKDKREQFTQYNKYNREWFRVLCTHLGKRTTEYSSMRSSKRGGVHITQKNYTNIHTSNFKDVITEMDYNGVVWCPNLPNTNFIARRKGKNGKYRIFITGNTFPEELVETPIIAGCPTDVCTGCEKPKIIEYETDKIDTRPGRNVLQGKSGTDENPNLSLHSSDLSKYRQQIVRSNFKYIAQCECGAGFKPGIVMDIFMGSGTVAVVAKRLNRDYIGIELNREYAEIADKRIRTGGTKASIPEGYAQTDVTKGL